MCKREPQSYLPIKNGRRLVEIMDLQEYWKIHETGARSVNPIEATLRNAQEGSTM